MRYTLVLLALALCGCASPGVPRPPSLHLPATVTGLTAMRVGDQVQLQWTAPSRTTDGLDLTIPTTVQICRDPVPAPSSPPQPPVPADLPSPTCTPVMTAPGHSGVSTATDQLVPPWTSPASTRPLLAYRVRILNPAGRSAPPSPAALVPAGPSLPAIAGFQARQTREGVVLEWPKIAADAAFSAPEAMVEVLRTAQTPQVSAKAPKKSPSNPFSRTQQNDRTASVRLRQGSTPSPSSTPEPHKAPQIDGMIDRSATLGMVYVYSAQRVQVIAQDGKTMEIRSEPTAPTMIAMRDTFPPAPPRGLVSVPGAPTANPGRTGAVDLAWEPNTESDLAGYFVYRIDLAEGAPGAATPTQLNASPILSSTYRDDSALLGHRYIYRVAAVDRNGNVSAFSLPVEDAPQVP